ncbi:THAP domain-containing protein 1-like [Formica exsecta]|uniref:THAP domain-containing protein 1-like n=1 Tax=Formica exsecta TaxID=72781 RepID=UPI001144E82A|nr:THAP domain-containing protein 1-like [Formica exsecta]
MVRHCSVSGCNVREKQGLMLFRFPRESERRAKWISLVNRSNWQPHANSTLCEIHFGKDQWEQRREDGSRKLQCSAIPSLLSSEENSSPVPYIPFLDEHNYCRLSSVPTVISHAPILLPQSRSLSKDVSNINVNKISIHPVTFVTSVNLAKKISASETQSPASSSVTDRTKKETVEALKRRLESKEKELEALQTKHVSMQKMADRVFNSYRNMRRQHEKTKIELKRLENFHRRSYGLLAVRLRQDQWKALCSKTTRGRKWSTPTITDALVYKMKWGTQGYSDFVREFPIFPSVRTLQKAV